MTETNKVNPLAGAAMAIAQRFGMGSASVEPSAQDEPTGRVHDEPAPDDQVAPPEVAERISAMPGTVEYVAALAAPIAKELAALAELAATQQKARLPYAIRVGAEFLRAKEVVKADEGDWKATLSVMCGCGHLNISQRTAYDWMLLAQPEYLELSQSSANVKEALEKIAVKREADKTKRKSPNPKPKATNPVVVIELETDEEVQARIEAANAAGLGLAEVIDTDLQDAFAEHDAEKVVKVFRTGTVFGGRAWRPSALRQIARGLDDLADE
jgi:hypothetical protein